MFDDTMCIYVGTWRGSTFTGKTYVCRFKHRTFPRFHMSTEDQEWPQHYPVSAFCFASFGPQPDWGLPEVSTAAAKGRPAAFPTYGATVVKGYGAIFGHARLTAPRRVDLPALGIPTSGAGSPRHGNGEAMGAHALDQLKKWWISDC